MILVYIILIGLPALLVFTVLKKMQRIKTVQKHGIQTAAIVVDLIANIYNQNRTDTIVLQFQDSTGAWQTAKATVVPGQYKPGDRVPLKYLERQPTLYSINGMQTGQWVLLIFSILLLVVMIVASFMLGQL